MDVFKTRTANNGIDSPNLNWLYRRISEASKHLKLEMVGSNPLSFWGETNRPIFIFLREAYTSRKYIYQLLPESFSQRGD